MKEVQARAGIDGQKVNSFVPGKSMQLAAVILVILLIPMQLLCQNTLRSVELNYIIIPL